MDKPAFDAEATVLGIVDIWRKAGLLTPHSSLPAYVSALVNDFQHIYDSAREEGHRSGIEEAAGICDGYGRDGSLTRTYECETADEIAARIRALTQRPAEEK